MIRNIRFILFALCVSLAAASHAEPQISEPAPLLDTALVGGGVLKAKELGGKIVLVVFWATWCPACATELPELQRFYNTYRKKGFEILALSLDKKAADVADYWNKKGYTFPLAMRAGNIRGGMGDDTLHPATGSDRPQGHRANEVRGRHEIRTAGSRGQASALVL